MKKSAKIILGALAVYVLLLFLLVAVESAAPDATIRSIGDAIWFSLVTMTTVGYGDLSPVTPAGRVLGLIFALCSIGILAALIGLGLNLIGGQLIPRLRLRLGRKRTWYGFDEENADAAVLARELRRTEPGCLLLFPAGGQKRLRGPNVVRLEADGKTLLRLRGGRTEGLQLFFLGPDPWENLRAAIRSAGEGPTVYCMADVPADTLPRNLHLFSREEAVSRCYWKEHPLTGGEDCVVLIGCGRTGGAVLERALLTNVFYGRRRVEYHVFQDTAGFAALHPRMLEALAPDAGEDRLYIHEEDWTACPDLLRRADRILLCADRDQESLETFRRLQTWFPAAGQVHVRLDEPVPGICSFGERESVITREFLMKDAINRQAVLMNDIYNEGSDAPTAWEELSAFLRQSNIAAADHLIVKVRYLLADESLTELTPETCRRAWERYRAVCGEQGEALQEMEHRRWLRLYWLYNWEYNPVRHNGQRRHPLMRPYEALDEAERRKDAYAWEMLGRLGERAGAEPGENEDTGPERL